jgi:hypothetical protein
MRQYFGTVTCFLKKGTDFLTLILINVWIFHSEAFFVFAAALPQTALYRYHQLDWMALITGGASHPLRKYHFAVVLKNYQSRPEAKRRAGERARLKGSLACPTSAFVRKRPMPNIINRNILFLLLISTVTANCALIKLKQEARVEEISTVVVGRVFSKLPVNSPIVVAGYLNKRKNKRPNTIRFSMTAVNMN